MLSMRILRKKLKFVRSYCNMGVIKSLFEKWACKHEWKCKAKIEYADGFQLLYICTKCGKMKKVWL